MSHTGGALPYQSGRMDKNTPKAKLPKPASTYLKRMYTDTVSPHSAGMKFAIEYYGIDNVMYGTDYPCWEPAQALKLIDELKLSAADKQKLFYDNARRILGLRDPAPAKPRASRRWRSSAHPILVGESAQRHRAATWNSACMPSTTVATRRVPEGECSHASRPRRNSTDRQHAHRQGTAVQDAADRRGRRARQFPALLRPAAGRGRRPAPQAQFRSGPHVPGRPASRTTAKANGSRRARSPISRKARPTAPSRATPSGSASRCSSAARAAQASSAPHACKGPWTR